MNRKNPMKLFMDDNRVTPPGFDLRTYTAQETIELLKTNKITMVSLDHDLGDEKQVGSGTQVINFIEEGAHFGTLNSMKIVVHTSNPVARERMVMAAASAYRKWGRKDVVEIVNYDLGTEISRSRK